MLVRVKNVFLIDLFPPYRKPFLAVYGACAQVFAAVLILLILFGVFRFTEPLISITVALALGAWYAHVFER